MASGLLVIGASQWKYAYSYLDKFHGFDVSVISVSGMRVDEVDPSMLLATEFFNDVVVHLGTNNLICGESPEEVVSHQETLLKSILHRNSHVRLYLSGVLMRSTSQLKPYTPWEGSRIEGMNKKIQRLNSLMVDLCRRMDIVFIDNWANFEAMDDDPYTQLLSRDGLHLTPRGVESLVGNVIRTCSKYMYSLNVLPCSPPVAASVPVSAVHPPSWDALSSQNSASSQSHSVLSSVRLNSNSSAASNPLSAIHPPSPYRDALLSQISASSRSHSVLSSVRLHYNSSAASNRLSAVRPPPYRSAALSSQISSPHHAALAPYARSAMPPPVPAYKLSSVFPSPQSKTVVPSKRPNKSSVFIKKCKSSTDYCSITSTSSSSTCEYNVPVSNRWSALSSLVDNEISYPFSAKSFKMKASKSIFKSVVNSPVSSSATLKHSKKSFLRKKRNAASEMCRPPLLLIPYPTPAIKDANLVDVSVEIHNGGSLQGNAGIVTIYPRKCDVCDKVYATRSSFCHHKSTCNKRKIIPVMTYPRICSACQVSYSNKSTYSRHQKHCGEGSQYIECPHHECNIKFQSHSAMISHLQTLHKDDISVEDYEFKDMHEFNVWKDNQCQLNFMSLVKHNGEHVICNRKLHYFICKFNNHHKNDIICNKTNRQRKYGRMPNRDCIARMLVRESECGVSVKYVNSHNHELEFKNVKYYRWDKKTKFQINSLLEQSVPAHKIQEYFQPHDPSLNNVLPVKEHFITSTQINKMKYELASKNHLNEDDAVAVHLLVNSLNDESKDSILVYKPLGLDTVIGEKGLDNLQHSSELFALGIQQKLQFNEMLVGCGRILCIDSTHGTNQYKFHLLNLIVPDEYGVGYPVAHFITSHLDEETLTCLLQSVRKRSPELNVNAVMTDGDEALGNAVRKVFGQETKHLLCMWHVKRNWQKNLHSKVKDNDVAREIYDILETLIEEKNDTTFNAMLNSFLEKYKDSAGAFVKYFKDYYCCKKEKWAMCYRNFPHAYTDTNMFVESFHNKLKSHYLNRKVNRRLDDLIQVLITIHKTIHLGLTYKRMTEVPPLGFQGFHINDHIRGMRILDEDVRPASAEKIWHVKSQSNSSTVYNVTILSEQCIYPDLCFVKCNEITCLGLCCHMYHCSCPNNYSLCKHVHKVHSFLMHNRSTPIATCDSHLSSPPRKQIRGATVSRDDKANPSEEQFVNGIAQLLDKLKNLSKHCTPDLLPYICKSLKQLVEKCEGIIANGLSDSAPNTIEAEGIPPNAKLGTQLKLYQTIRNRRPVVHRFKRPDTARKADIKKSLLQEETYFTEPLTIDSDPFVEIFRVGHFSLKLFEVKSLDINITDYDFSIIRRVVNDFQRGWLYDTVIAAFLWKIASKYPNTVTVDPSVSQYVTGIVKLDRPMVMLDDVDTLGNPKIIIPFNSHSHWLLIVAWPSEKRIDFYDPAGESVKEVYHYAVIRWITVLKSKYGGKESEWTVKTPQHSMQRDGYNCGVFISWYAERVMNGKSTSETFDADNYRKYMFDVLME